jgi:mannose-6-phosphate isomerase-like protein (cupin superfamily)
MTDGHATDEHTTDGRTPDERAVDERVTDGGATEAYTTLDVGSAPREPSASSGTMHVDLIEELGCTEMRPKVWHLSPGDAMSYHRQTEQEEFYYVLSGPARMKIEGELMDVPEGTALRIPPETSRQVLNDTAENGDGDGSEGEHGEEHVWLIIGAPPVPDDGRAAAE